MLCTFAPIKKLWSNMYGGGGAGFREPLGGDPVNEAHLCVVFVRVNKKTENSFNVLKKFPGSHLRVRDCNSVYKYPFTLDEVPMQRKCIFTCVVKVVGYLPFSSPCVVYQADVDVVNGEFNIINLVDFDVFKTAESLRLWNRPIDNDLPDIWDTTKKVKVNPATNIENYQFWIDERVIQSAIFHLGLPNASAIVDTIRALNCSLDEHDDIVKFGYRSDAVSTTLAQITRVHDRALPFVMTDCELQKDWVKTLKMRPWGIKKYAEHFPPIPRPGWKCVKTLDEALRRVPDAQYVSANAAAKEVLAEQLAHMDMSSALTHESGIVVIFGCELLSSIDVQDMIPLLKDKTVVAVGDPVCSRERRLGSIYSLHGVGAPLFDWEKPHPAIQTRHISMTPVKTFDAFIQTVAFEEIMGCSKTRVIVPSTIKMEASKRVHSILGLKESDFNIKMRYQVIADLKSDVWNRRVGLTGCLSSLSTSKSEKTFGVSKYSTQAPYSLYALRSDDSDWNSIIPNQDSATWMMHEYPLKCAMIQSAPEVFALNLNTIYMWCDNKTSYKDFAYFTTICSDVRLFFLQTDAPKIATKRFRSE